MSARSVGSGQPSQLQEPGPLNGVILAAETFRGASSTSWFLQITSTFGVLYAYHKLRCKNAVSQDQMRARAPGDRHLAKAVVSIMLTMNMALRRLPYLGCMKNGVLTAHAMQAFRLDGGAASIRQRFS